MSRNLVFASPLCVVLRRATLPLIAALALAGCSPSSLRHNVRGGAETLPQQQVADFLATDCEEIWSLSGEEADKNPLYWLRGMDCAQRLSPAQARAAASAFADDDWQDAFKRAILLANAKITPIERKALVTRIDELSQQIPGQLRPLFQLWRDGQALELALADARFRYSKLQQSTDGELDALRQQDQLLRDQLDATTRKLENLTDIERQLSTRKPAGGYAPDVGHGGRSAASGEEKP